MPQAFAIIAKGKVDNVVKELLHLCVQQELRSYAKFRHLRGQCMKHGKEILTMNNFYDLSHYWFLLQPFSNRNELEELHSRCKVYNSKRKNEAKLWMEIPDINHSLDDDFKENAAFLAWCIYRGFFMNKVHENLKQFLKDAQYYLESLVWPQQVELTTTYKELGITKPYYTRTFHYPHLYDKEPSAVADCLLRYLKEDYVFFIRFFIKYKKDLKSPLNEDAQLRILMFWLKLLPLNLTMLYSLKNIKLTDNYVYHVFAVIARHWNYIRTLKKRNLRHYYLHTVFYRNNVPGLSSFVLNVLPETRRRFQEFLLEQEQFLK